MAASEREDRRRYRKIHTRIHGDGRFRRLSKPQPNGQTLFFYLLTGPHTTNVPGLSSAGERMLAERLGWPLAAFRRCFTEVAGYGMAFADWKAPMIWLPNAISYNEPESPNVVRSWSAAFDEMPECLLKVQAGGSLRSYLRDHFNAPFEQALPEGWPEAFTQAPTQPCDNQEQEQEQEPDLRRDASREARKAEDKALGTGAFVKRFCDLYAKYRHGAKYRILDVKHIPLLRGLLRTYGAERLEKLAVVMLNATADDWLNQTDRGVEVLHTKVNWLEQRLAEHEAQRKVS